MSSNVRMIAPLPRVPQTAEERFDAIDRRLEIMSAELREMLTITRRLATIIDGTAKRSRA